MTAGVQTAGRETGAARATTAPALAPTPIATPKPVAAVTDFTREQAGNVSSALSIVGAGALIATHREGRFARAMLYGGMAAGGVDTAFQLTGTVSGGTDGASVGSTLYAATGLLPGAMLAGSVKLIEQEIVHPQRPIAPQTHRTTSPAPTTRSARSRRSRERRGRATRTPPGTIRSPTLQRLADSWCSTSSAPDPGR